MEPGEIMQDPALEARARRLSQELRCLVCQNQSIDDSAATLARCDLLEYIQIGACYCRCCMWAQVVGGALPVLMPFFRKAQKPREGPCERMRIAGRLASA